MRRLSAHEVLRLAPSLPGTEVRAFYEAESRAVQVMFVGTMIELDLDAYELGLVFALAPALDGRFEPARLVSYPEFRWQPAIVSAYGDGLGAQVRAWAIEAYGQHLDDQEYRLHVFRMAPGASGKRREIDRTLALVRRMRHEFRIKVGVE